MDNLQSIMRYGPNRWPAVAATVAALALVALLLQLDDRAGRLLYGAAAVALVVFSVVDLVWNPRLIVDARGLTLHTPTASGLTPWADVDAIRVDERTRFGLASQTLEIDAGPTLVILGRRALGGADPRDVAAVIDSFRRA